MKNSETASAMSSEHFSIANIPFGIASSAIHPTKSVVTRLHDNVIFLDRIAESYTLEGLSKELISSLSQPTVNDLAALPKSQQHDLRARLQTILVKGNFPDAWKEDISAVQMHLPVDARGFTDFSCSKEHCLNAGEAIMKKRLLPPGFLHFPIGYSGRASSIVVSGTSITRPKGHFREGSEVIYGPTKQLDYELEVAAIIGKPTVFGETVSVHEADDHIFGLVLINDWSARDIQALEMSPLGPMNGKSFGTTMSPWVITLDALKPFEISPPPKDSPAAPVLQDSKVNSTYDIHLQAELITEESTTIICKSELKWMYWTLRDLVTHQASNGCNLNTADVLATGTISGTTDDSHGCLLELTQGGEEAFALKGAGSRTYLQDGDGIRLTAYASEGVGFGSCFGKIVGSKQN